MQIGLEDIDREIALQLAARLQTAPGSYLQDNIAWKGAFPWQFGWSRSGFHFAPKRPFTAIEEKAYRTYLQRRRRVRNYKAYLTGAVGFTVLLAMLSYVLYALAASLSVLWGLWGLCLVGTLGCSLGAFLHIPTPLRQAVPVEELAAALPLLKLTPPERAYADTVLLLAQLPSTSRQQEQELRTTLAHLGRLLESNRQLEHTRQNLLQLQEAENLENLSEEYRELCEKRDATKDPAARSTLEYSIKLCLERIAGLHALKSNLERITAQQKAIEQTLAAARNALGRLQSQPHLEPQLENASQEVYNTIEQVRQQAQAAEQAAIELLQLH